MGLLDRMRKGNPANVGICNDQWGNPAPVFLCVISREEGFKERKIQNTK